MTGLILCLAFAPVIIICAIAIYSFLFDESENVNCEEPILFSEIKRQEIDYEYGKCLKNGVQLVTLWWLIDVDGLQMQEDGTVKRVGRRAEAERQAEMMTEFWKNNFSHTENITQQIRKGIILEVDDEINEQMLRLNQIEQTQTIIASLKPCPMPTYSAYNPYQQRPIQYQPSLQNAHLPRL